MAGSADDGRDPTGVLPAPAHHVDQRGALTAVDLGDVPFPVRRVFTVSGVPAGVRRGGHRHRSGVQALFCTCGQVEVELRGARFNRTEVLHPGGPGLLLPAGVWSSQRYLVEGSTLLVLCRDPYDPDSYDPDSHDPDPVNP